MYKNKKFKLIKAVQANLYMQSLFQLEKICLFKLYMNKYYIAIYLHIQVIADKYVGEKFMTFIIRNTEYIYLIE